MSNKSSFNPVEMVATAGRGFCMGLADIVPGVSGGTIALIFGIYARLIANVRQGAKALGALVKLDFTGFKERFAAVEWTFIIPLVAGVGIAFVGLATLIEGLLEDYPEEMAGLFLGLVMASVVIAAQQVKGWTPTIYGIAIGVAIAAFILLGFQNGAANDPALWAFLGAGAIAICAMILPGISGSFLLLMMGMYVAFLDAIHDRAILEIGVFLLGATIGLALFSTLLNRLLEDHHDPLLAALTGLMVGSIRVLWPWPNGVGIISDEADEAVKGTTLGAPNGFADFFWPSVLAVGAFVVVVGISTIADRRAADPAEASPHSAPVH